MAKTIVIVGTLDTKGEEIKYVKELIEAKGHRAIVIDTGVLEEPPFPPDFSHYQVAEAGGGDLKEIATQRDEGKALAVMSAGAVKIAMQLHSDGRLDGIIALGGSMGTSLGLSVMRALPLGVPKLMVSTVAFTPFVAPEDVSADQVVFQCVVDFSGLDRWTKMTIERAALAIVAMAETYAREVPSEKPVVGMTTLGTAPCRYVWHAKRFLEQRGYEVAVFHSNGIGGRTFERLIEEGLIAGSLDLCTHELIGNLYGAGCDAGPNRLEAAGKMGIPQVVAPGVLGILSWPGPPETLPPRFRNRKLHMHNPRDTVPPLNAEEMAELAEVMARKLNRATGPTAVLIPTQGFFEADKPDGIFYMPEERKAFTERLKKQIEPKVRVIEVDLHLNDPEFAEQAVAILDAMMRGEYKT